MSRIVIPQLRCVQIPAEEYNRNYDISRVKEIGLLFLRIASCCVYYYNVFGFRKSQLYFSSVLLQIYYNNKL
jgi:hypothetical protein